MLTVEYKISRSFQAGGCSCGGGNDDRLLF